MTAPALEHGSVLLHIPPCPRLEAIAGSDVQDHLIMMLLCRIAPHVAFTLIFVATLPKIEAKMGL